MESKTYLDVVPLINNSNLNIQTSSIPFLISNPSNSLSSSLLEPRRSNKSYSNTIVVTQPTASNLSSDAIKQEQFNINSLRETFAKTNRNRLSSATVTPVHLNSRENLNSLSLLPMTNTNNHLMAALNPAHLSDGSGSYFVSGLNDIAANFKLNPSSNTDLPSPSSSSNSSNPPSSSHHHHHNPHHHHQTRRHGEGSDPTRKREMRLQKNREAARECRRKKKEYIKCLEERVAGLETQNKALIEELRQLKELYCQREDTNKKK